MNLGAFVRGAFAVIASYILFAVPGAAIFALTGHEPHAPASVVYMALTTLWGMAFAFSSGYLAALIGGEVARKAPAVLGGLIAFGAILTMLVTPAGGARWSPIAAALFMAPSAVLGGMLRRRHKTLA